MLIVQWTPATRQHVLDGVATGDHKTSKLQEKANKLREKGEATVCSYYVDPPPPSPQLISLLWRLSLSKGLLHNDTLAETWT